MHRPATPAHAARPARRARPSSMVGSPRLSPHTPLRTHTTQQTTILLSASLRGAERRSNPSFPARRYGLLRYARSDGEVFSTQYAFSLLVINASGVLSRM